MSKYDPTFERVMAFQNLEVVHVVAMDQQRCIGKGNDLPWHISADLKHFKAITQGGVVIMGRKTLGIDGTYFTQTCQLGHYSRHFLGF